MKKIQLTQGHVALVDDEDYDFINQFTWRLSKVRHLKYAKTNKNKIKNKATHYLMHRMILNLPSNLLIDHIDGNGLNNQKSNLRIATHNQNIWNSKGYGSSQYKGVYPFRTKQKYKKKNGEISIYLSRTYYFSSIFKNGITYYLGNFKNEIDAALAYDKKAKELFGEFAYLNFPES